MKHFFISVSLALYNILDAEAVRANKISGTFCTFKEKRYNPGDTWHPYLEPYGLMFCMRCTCTETGHVNCNTIKCPVLRCENPVTDSQQCCPRCAVEPRSPAGLRAPVKSCQYNGSLYQPGETFSNDELFPSRQPNQCVMCSCSNGNIFCALKTCLKLTCTSPVFLPDTCCPVCTDAAVNANSASTEDGGQQLNRGVRHSQDQCSQELVKGRALRATPATARSAARGINLQGFRHRGAAGTTVKIVLQKKHKRACVYNGKTYSHGDVWHPVLGRVLECILCTCRDGVQECQRITCPSQYPCQHPKKTEGQCCKRCPELNEESSSTQCHQGKGNSDLVLYKVESGSDTAVRKIAVDREGAVEIEVHVWKTVEGVLHLMDTEKLPRKEVTEHPGNFVFLTRLDEENWRKFKETEGQRTGFTESRTCDGGIMEVVKFLNPEQSHSLCAS